MPCRQRRRLTMVSRPMPLWVTAKPFLERLDAVMEHAPFDLFIPTLDAEIELLVHLEKELGQRRIRTFVGAIHESSCSSFGDINNHVIELVEGR